MDKADIGLIGLAVMGENLVLNMLGHGFRVAVHNRSYEKVEKFVAGRAVGKSVVPCADIKQLCESLERPRRVMMMIRAGAPVDSVISQLVTHLDEGDIVIDGGNSNYLDTNRRVEELSKKGIHFVGAGISGGEEGALNGPSIMPGGDEKAWPHIKEIFQKIAAKVDGDTPCCDWVGDAGAGHFVKMVHNGIEYGDMQLICEAYDLMKRLLGLSNEELADVFTEWNRGVLDSYLIEITSEIFRKKTEDNSEYVIDLILDKAGQKGTGKWTAITALELGEPLTLIGEAVFARCLSALKDERVEASKLLAGPEFPFEGDKKTFIANIRDALYCSKIVSYAQGFELMRAAGKEFSWSINYGSVAMMWRGGCIIRSKFLANIKDAFDQNPQLANLLLDKYFKSEIEKSQQSWRQVVVQAIASGIPMPAFSSALAYFDGYRTQRLPANLIQAQRDYFGAHMYERIDQKRGEYFHTDWTGEGGDTSSTTYNV